MTKEMSKCPKCGYTRTPDDVAPEWQCPKCHVAYAKVATYNSRIEGINQRRENENVLGLREYSLLILLNTALYFLLVPIINVTSELFLQFWETKQVSGLIFVLLAPVHFIFSLFYIVFISITPLIVGLVTRSLITHRKTYHKSMEGIEAMFLFIIFACSNYFVSMAIPYSDFRVIPFNTYAEACLAAMALFIFAQERTGSIKTNIKMKNMPIPPTTRE